MIEVRLQSVVLIINFPVLSMIFSNVRIVFSAKAFDLAKKLSRASPRVFSAGANFSKTDSSDSRIPEKSGGPDVSCEASFRFCSKVCKAKLEFSEITARREETKAPQAKKSTMAAAAKSMVERTLLISSGSSRRLWSIFVNRFM